MRRGDVVIVDFPFASGVGAKIRPALVVQNDTDNLRIKNTIIALITGNLARQGEPTHLLVDPATVDGAKSGLKKPSLVNCSVLFTIEQADVIAMIGQLSGSSMLRINDCLRAALELP